MKRIFLLILAVFFAAGAASVSWAADAYSVDKDHSSVGFAVKHMMVGKVNGLFNDYRADIKFDAADFANSKFDFVIKAASIDTRNEARDKHLRSGDFFEAEKYPDIIFKTKKVEKTGDGAYAVAGDLTMKNVTKEVVVTGTVDGPVFNPMAKVDGIGIEASFTLNRQDYGVNWNKALDNGGVVVGDDVRVNVSLEAHKIVK